MDTDTRNILLILLEEACVKHGFCDVSISDFEKVNLTADNFANLVIEKEGLNPEYELKRKRIFKNKFIARFGTHTL